MQIKLHFIEIAVHFSEYLRLWRRHPRRLLLCSGWLWAIRLQTSMISIKVLKSRIARFQPATALINLLDYARRYQRQQQFMVAHEIDPLSAPGGGSADYICKRSIMFDKIHVYRREVVQCIP